MIFFGKITHDRPVYFGDFLIMFLEHFVQSYQCLTGFGEQYNSTYGAIHPVRNPEVNISRFVIFLFDVCLNTLAERFVTCLVCLHNIGNLFVDSDNVVILV